MPELEQLYEPDEAAAKLHVGHTKFWRLVASGGLPVVRLGPRKVLCRESDLAAFIEAHVVVGTP